MLVVDVGIAAAGVRLPDFDERVGDAAAVFIDHAAMHDDALAERLTRVLAREIAVGFAHRLVAVNRPGQFR